MGSSDMKESGIIVNRFKRLAIVIVATLVVLPANGIAVAQATKEREIKDLFKKLIDAENRHDLPAVRALVYEHEKVGDAIPTRAERPGHLVIPGPETIAGIQFDFHLVKHAETEDALVIGIPHAGILIVQNLINKVHAFLDERS